MCIAPQQANKYIPFISFPQFSLKIITKILLTTNIFIMDNYLSMSPGSRTTKISLNFRSRPNFTTFFGTTDYKAHFTSTENKAPREARRQPPSRSYSLGYYTCIIS